MAGIIEAARLTCGANNRSTKAVAQRNGLKENKEVRLAVLAEMFSVILQNSKIEAIYPGGLEEYKSVCPNATFCTDDEICRIGFMALTDAENFINSLERMGFRRDSGAFALLDEGKGLLQPCAWIMFGRVQGIAAAWLIGSQLKILVAQPGWSPRQRAASTYITHADLERDYERIGARDGVETYRNRESGELVYIGRVQPPKK